VQQDSGEMTVAID